MFTCARDIFDCFSLEICFCSDSFTIQAFSLFFHFGRISIYPFTFLSPHLEEDQSEKSRFQVRFLLPRTMHVHADPQTCNGMPDTKLGQGGDFVHCRRSCVYYIISDEGDVDIWLCGGVREEGIYIWTVQCFADQAFIKSSAYLSLSGPCNRVGLCPSPTCIHPVANRLDHASFVFRVRAVLCNRNTQASVVFSTPGNENGAPLPPVCQWEELKTVLNSLPG